MVCPACVAPYIAAAVLAFCAAAAGTLSSWFVYVRRGLAAVSEALARRVLRALQLAGGPQSIAFIMDGNRRWARAQGRPGYEGYPRGGDTFGDTLQWCLDAGVRSVTVYAFSTENFKRPQREVAEIFSLAHEKVLRMLDETDLVQRHRVRVNVLGDLQRLPDELRLAFAQAMHATRHFVGGPTLNICFSYTSREEMASALCTAVGLCDSGEIFPEDIDEHLLAACLYTGVVLNDGAVPIEKDSEGRSVFERATFGFPDLVVRTSGEIRLSDFLLMQSSDSVISFQPYLWPDLTAWRMVQIILDYQFQLCSAPRVRRSRSVDDSDFKRTGFSVPAPSKTYLQERVQRALRKIRQSNYEGIDAEAQVRTANASFVRKGASSTVRHAEE